MAKFLNRLQIVAADDTDDGQWQLAAALIYQSDVANATFVVPKGFRTDLASVPRLPMVYEMVGDTASAAACVHDFLYSTHPVNRAMADAVLREACAATGVPAWRRWMLWAGVRIGGASHW